MPNIVLRRRFALALVVAFALSGVIGYAHVIGSHSANGHGNFFDDPMHVSFSFHAEASQPFEASGEFEYRTQADRGPGLTVHGDVVCLGLILTTVNKYAILIGRVTRSNDPGFAVDDKVVWEAVDNGTGGKAVPDELSRLSVIDPGTDCTAKTTPLAPVPIAGGNIQVQ